MLRLTAVFRGRSIPCRVEHQSHKISELRFGKYHLIATLGQGGMADVFLAATQGPAGFSKLHVIKRLRRSDIGDELDVVTMFLDEARLSARLNHPNVVQTNEVGDAEGEYFIAMEYLDGQPLNRIIYRLRGQQLQDDRTEAILLQIVADALAGLHYAHELSDYDGTPLHVVHRDASPHNIFVTYEGHTKVVDFGIAKAAIRSSQTTAGVLKGKLAYMSPEQARAKPVDRRADIFVIGIVLWEILARRKMWKGLEDMAIINRIFSRELPQLEEVRPDVPADLAAIVRRALAYEPEDRYATAAEVRADLLRYLERAGQRISSEEIGALVLKLFADRRASLQAVIDGQIKRLRSMGAAPLIDMNSSLPPPSGLTPASKSATPSSSEPLPNLSYPATSDSSSVTRQSALAPPSPAPQARRLLFPALAAAAVVGMTTLLLLRGGAPDTAAPPVGAAVSVAPTAAATPPAPQQSAADPPDVPRTVELRITTSPSAAKIFLDDVLLGPSPFSGRFPADGARHLIRVEAPGHAAQKEFAEFTDDITMEFDLTKKAAATVSYRPRGGWAKAAEEQGEPTSSEPSPSDAPQSGATATATAKPKRSLSGSDPWSGTPVGSPQPATTATSTTTKPKRQLSGSDPWGGN